MSNAPHEVSIIRTAQPVELAKTTPDRSAGSNTNNQCHNSAHRFTLAHTAQHGGRHGYAVQIDWHLSACAGALAHISPGQQRTLRLLPLQSIFTQIKVELCINERGHTSKWPQQKQPSPQWHKTCACNADTDPAPKPCTISQKRVRR